MNPAGNGPDRQGKERAESGIPIRLVAACIPEFVQRVLYLHAAERADAGPLSSIQQNGAENEPCPQIIPIHYREFEAYAKSPGHSGYDCVLLTALPQESEPLCSIMALAEAILDPDGAVLCLRPATTKALESELFSAIRAARLEPYVAWDISAGPPCPQRAGPVSDWRLARRTDIDDGPPEKAAFSCLMAVKRSYDPLAHARALVLRGAPGFAFNVLSLVPEVYLKNPRVRAAVKAEQGMCLLAWDQAAADGCVLPRFHLAQAFFAQATAADAHCHLAYNVQAEFWRRLGDEDMAARLLRSVLHVAPNEAVADQLKTYRTGSARRPIEVEPPEWRSFSAAPRILLLTDNRPNYGLDVLYDGLHRVMGDDRVTEFPWKPTLHGEKPERFADYPCCFDYPSQPFELEGVLDELRSGRFDLIVFGDMERITDHGVIRQIVENRRKIPLVILDMLDDPRDNRPEALEWLGIERAAGYFKREKLACVDYGPDAYPMPFAYPDGLIPDSVDAPRPCLLFWAGQRQFGMRKLCLEYLEKRLGIDLGRRFPQEEYIRRLQSSRIGIDISGFGFDTVRYWEIPAHGCMLLAERRPTVIPLNFQDGESAVFFDDVADLEKKILYYGTHADEAAAIARAGHEHLCKHHSSSARARHLLGWVHRMLT